MEVNQVFSGFKLIKKEYLEELDSTAYLFNYEQTQTPLLYLSNQDNNKVFQIAFRTPSNNSTGVAHINEHAVLCGSRKYPVKEPFVELAKGSLNTFLNAMTYPDKTVYPIASTNDKDFMNLMDVYLDAVFYPDIDKKENIFKQEGWHYHIENAADPLTYNGVVYNEMKGAYSNPEEILHNELFKTLYPDTIYGKESGGFPADIPDLSYEEFLDFHHKLYHPSNAYIYFYGNGNIKYHLKYLSENYLSNFYYHRVDSHIDIQAPFDSMRESTAYYPVSGDEKNKDYLALGYVMSPTPDYVDVLSFDILANVLLGDNSAPLKKALLDLGVAQDIDYSFSSALKQPYFSIVLKNTEEGKKDLIYNTIQNTLKELVKNGIDPKALEAGINSAAFTLKESDFGPYPKGLMYGLELMDSWLYDGDPLTHLKYNEALNQIREASHNGGFEGMIEKDILNNPHCAFVVIKPDNHLAEKNETELADKLKNYKEQLNDTEINALVKQTKDLIKYQSTPDSPEALETIPKLSLDEIETKARIPQYFEEDIDGTKLLWHPAKTNGITYIRLFFNINVIPQEKLETLSLLNKLLFRLSTENRTYEELNQDIDIYTGGITTSIDTFDHTKKDTYSTQFIVKGKALNDNVEKLIDIVADVLTSTRFSEKNLIESIVQEVLVAKENKFLTAGNTEAIHRLEAYYSESAAVFQKLGGLDFCRYLGTLKTDFSNAFDHLEEKLSSITDAVFNRSYLTISLTCEEKEKATAIKALQGLIGRLHESNQKTHTYHFELNRRNEGIMTPSKINYAAKGYNIRKLGYEYSGTLFVLKSLLSMDYLWNQIRIQGGAYGASFGILKSGDLFLSSYRDPHIERTLNTFDQVGKYLSSLDLSQREIEKHIIGSISSKDIPYSDAVLANSADTMYFNGLTSEDLQRERDEILSVSLDSLKNCAEVLDASMEKDNFCVIGNEDQIKRNGALFNEITYLQQK